MAASLRKGLWSLVVVTWMLIGFGALVRAMKAGLACPDWPLCFGDVVPDVRLEGVIYEFGHRVLAGLVSIGFAVVGVLVWRDAACKKLAGRTMLLGGVVLLAQIVMGGLTVLIVEKGHGGDPRPAAWTVTTHLLLGNSFAACIAWAASRLGLLGSSGKQQSDHQMSPEIQPAAGPALLIAWTCALLGQFLLGGLIASNLAGMVCIEFPACSGGVWFPSWSGFVGLQLAHRLNAYLLVALGFGLAWQARRYQPTLARVVAALIVMQVLAGAANIWLRLPPTVTVIHSALASALFVSTALLWAQRRAWRVRISLAG